MTIVIGLTGGIASGKSLVSTYLKEKGLPVIDADVVAHEVVALGQPLVKALIKEFGEKIAEGDGINRQALGEIIFANPEKRQKLNSLMHPAIFAKMMMTLSDYQKQQEPIVILDIPLLFESNRLELYDKIWVVAVDEETQKQRLMLRNDLTEQEAVQRITSQLPLAEKIQRADTVIDNNGTPTATFEQVDVALAAVVCDS